MIQISIVLLFFFLLFFYLRDKQLYNPIFIFVGFWTLILFLSSLNLFDMYAPSNFAYFIVLLSLVSFILGVLITRHVLYTSTFTFMKRKTQSKVVTSFRMNTRLFNFLLVLLLIYNISNAIWVVSLLTKGYSLDLIRLFYFNPSYASIIGADLPTLFGNIRILKFIEVYFNLPMQYILTAYLSFNIFSKNRNNKHIFLIILIILTSTLYTGGRVILYILGVELFISLLITRKTLRKRTVLIFASGVIIIVTLLYLLSIYRNSAVEYNVLRSIYIYFTGGVTHMSILLENNLMDYNSNFGLNLISGFVQPIFMVLENIGINISPRFLADSNNLLIYVSETSQIGENISFNAFTTMFFAIYLELGLIGLFFVPMVFGMISYNIYSKIIRNKLERDIVLYLLLIQGIITSMIRWQFMIVSYAMAFYFIKILYSKTHKKDQR